MVQRTDIYFDFEFIDDGSTITPISLGMCVRTPEAAPGPPGSPVPHELYIEYAFDPARANDWVRENVFPRMGTPGSGWTRQQVAKRIVAWVKDVCGDTKPRFWGYYPSYDWVLLCQHFGTMMQIPHGWPKRPECLMQLADTLAVKKEFFPPQEVEHQALADAKWNRDLHAVLQGDYLV